MQNDKSKFKKNKKFLLFNCNFDFCILSFTLIQILILSSALLSFPNFIYSAEPNNKFGIHFAQPHFSDIKKAAEMINGNGGDWGYITLVIQENDRNHQKWQEIFDLLRQYHLIPIVRLATYPDGAKWKRPAKEEAQAWVDFLDSLNWVVKNRYIILFNEPNHGAEWGGEVDPGNYAEVAFEFAKKLKEKSPDFFVMLAGLDASSPHQPPQFWDEEVFLRTIIDSAAATHQTLFDFIDGWVSHSYPNPAFSGSPWNRGRGTVKTYEWELELLRNLGVTKQLPVFITETGWEKQDQKSKVKSQNYLNENIVAEYFKIAFEQVWLPDERVMAVTPFVFDYQGEPFLDFSWKKYQSEDYYPQYYMVQSMPKTKGDPERIEKGEIIADLPKEIVVSSSYHFRVKLKNKGQAIWDKDNSYKLEVRSEKLDTKLFDYVASDIKNIKPFEEVDVDLYIKTNKTGSFISKLTLIKKDRTVIETDSWQYEVVPLPNLDFQVTLYPKLKTKEGNFEIQIFDDQEELVFKRKNIAVKNNWGVVDALQNIVLDKKYRVVLLRPYYLPRQDFVKFKRGSNIIKFKRMYPLDFNCDGKFEWRDIWALFKKPELIGLLLP